MFSLPAFGYQGPFKSPEAQQWHRDRAGVSGELPELHERGRITDGHLDELFASMTTRLEEVQEAARTAAVHQGAAAQEAVGGVPQSPAVFESATGASAGQAGLPMLSRDQPHGDDGAYLFEDRMEEEYLADRQRAYVERQRRAGHGTAGSSFGRAAAALADAASSDETASERDDDDDPQDFFVDDYMFDAGFDPHADQGPVDQDGAGILRKLRKGPLRSLRKGARDFGRRKLCPDKTAPAYDGENHAPCANFCGPGTRIYDRIQRGDQPVNSADAACMHHDLDYAKIVEEQKDGKLNDQQVVARVREADDAMLAAVARTKGEGGLMSAFHHVVGQEIISGKKKLEDLGVLHPQKFVDPEDSSNVLLGAGSPLALELGLDVLRGNGYGMDDNLVQR
jgi:hypothetical protein